MKNLIVAALIFGSVVLHAQRGEHSKMHQLSVEQIATLQTKKLTLALDLNETQQRSVQKLNEENAQLKKEKLEARKAARETSERKEPNSDEKFKHQLERLDKAIAHKAKMKDILSEDQFEEWEQIQKRKGHHRKSRSKGNRAKPGKHRG